MQCGPGGLRLVRGGCRVVVGRWEVCCQGVEWFRKAGECGFGIKVMIQPSFGLSFPIQGIIMDHNVHHFL